MSMLPPQRQSLVDPLAGQTACIVKLEHEAIEQKEGVRGTLGPLEEAETQRHAATVQLAAEMGHEINNPLACALSNIELALESLVEVQRRLQAFDNEGARTIESLVLPLLQGLEDARHGSLRVSHIVRELEHRKLPTDTAPVTTTERTPASKLPALAARRVRVLAIDDEPAIGRAFSRMLRDHDVVVFEDAREALQLLHTDDAFDVIFCDITMAAMSGIAFYEALRKERPALASKIVFVSGGACTHKAESFLRSTSNIQLQKPLSPDEVRRVVAACVANASEV